MDVFRYPKSTPTIISRYNQPLFVAVKPRRQIAEAGTAVPVDFYIINEKDVKGNLLLRVRVTDPDGR